MSRSFDCLRYARLFHKPADHLSLYTYEDRDGALELLVEFDGAAVKKALRESGATYWNESRPSVLVWLVMDDSRCSPICVEGAR